MEFIQIKETCLYVSDLDESSSFYHGLLGLSVIDKVPGRHVFFKLGTSILLCFISDATKSEQGLPAHYAKGKQHIAFEVSKESYESTKVELMQLGIPVIKTHQWSKEVESFYFEDPDGHVLEIVPSGMWG